MKPRTLTGKAKAIFFAIAVHAVFLVVLLISFNWSPDIVFPTQPRQKSEPIQATVLDETRVETELAEIEKQKRAEEEAEQARLRKLEQEARAARERREKEEKKLAQIQKELKAQERKRKEEAKKEAERQQLVKEKAEKERRRKAEEKAAKEKAAKEKARKEAERKRREAEKALQKKLAAEQAERDREHQQLLNRYRLEYVTNIKSAVEGNWTRPPGAKKGLKCKLKVTQTPDGRVLDVSITDSSGNAAFDRSAVAAVYKASPLPKPRDPSMFDRNIVLTLLNPED
uniref:Colicin import membrane protein n=1 Tax=Candidatus Kentrum sp. DK TaxID=2126562 RepID=A0A450TBA3_9GAMM|nr:MAG: colicin import membrane protein [Candidatus Kentron sp. DK]VFJ64004.1 MAG: colicin import membrane protein [Candidatus Kentron sp. DK]